MKVVIVDPETYRPYSQDDLAQGGLGGTEATVIRVAEALDAVVMQHNRTEDSGRYVQMNLLENPTHIVVVRDPNQAIQQAELRPSAKTFLWLHDLVGVDTPRGKTLGKLGPRLASANITLICVSDFQAAQVKENFVQHGLQDRPKVTRIYNPAVIDSQTLGLPDIDKNKLIFFSSRQKGLDYALFVFSYLHSRNPLLRLFLANPGYYPSAQNEIPGVVYLGSLPHAQVMEHVRTSLCTFYPNYSYPETFGLVMAESNAVGTPVLAHPIGAALEVLRGHDQLIAVPFARLVSDRLNRRFPKLSRYSDAIVRNIGALKRYEDRVNSWRSGGRPQVSAHAEFALASVVAEWHKAFSATGNTGI